MSEPGTGREGLLQTVAEPKIFEILSFAYLCGERGLSIANVGVPLIGFRAEPRGLRFKNFGDSFVGWMIVQFLEDQHLIECRGNWRPPFRRQRAYITRRGREVAEEAYPLFRRYHEESRRYVILACLEGAGGRGLGYRPLKRATGLSRETLEERLIEMEGEGLVKVRRDAFVRRRRFYPRVSATEAGRAAYREWMGPGSETSLARALLSTVHLVKPYK